MGTIDITHQITVTAGAEAVWAVLADYGRDVEWRTGVVRMESTPADEVEVGTTTTEVLRVGGRSYTNLGEVTAVDRGRRFEWRTTAGANAHGARAVRPLDGDRCEVRHSGRRNPRPQHATGSEEVICDQRARIHAAPVDVAIVDEFDGGIVRIDMRRDRRRRERNIRRNHIATETHRDLAFDADMHKVPVRQRHA